LYIYGGHGKHSSNERKKTQTENSLDKQTNNMRKIIAFFHISLDGYVSAPNGALNWVKIDQELFSFVGNRIQKGDKALYGRKTFQMMESYWPEAGAQANATEHDINHSKWYNSIHKIVLSNTLRSTELINTTTISNGEFSTLKEMLQDGEEDILLFGSPTAAHALMEQGMIDGYWLFVNPVILGEGVSLFKDNKHKSELELVSSHVLKSGVVELNYVVKR